MKQTFKKLLISPFTWTLVVSFVGIVTWIRQGNEFWVDPDRKAQRLLDAGNSEVAADTFINPTWRGIAQYRSGDFKAALQTFSALPGQDQRFNQANSLVMLGRYEDAVKLYEQVLSAEPERQDAKINLSIAKGRAERLKDEGGQMTGGKLEADEIVFEPMKNEDPSGDDADETETTQLSDEEMRGLWLRQVQTTPGDFLRAKFAYQIATQSNQDGEDSDE